MWAGPHNPMGSYAFPAQYGDGTAVYPNDFSTDDYPDSADWETRWIYGELDYYKMVPPSSSCMGVKMPPNIKVRTKSKSTFSKFKSRPVVCKGKK